MWTASRPLGQGGVTLPRRPHLRVAGFVLVACLRFLPSALATDFTWLPPAGGNFSTAGNWTPAGGPPDDTSDKAIFGPAATYTVLFSNDVTNASLDVQAGTVTLDLHNSGLNAVYAYFLDAAAGPAATIGTVAGPLVSLILDGGMSPTGLSTVNASSFLQIGRDAGSHGRVELDETDWVSPVNVFVGVSGTGELQIGTNAEMINADGVIGFNAGSDGHVEVGASGRWTNTGLLFIGFFGDGTLTLDGGTVASTGDANVAASIGSTGTVQINAGLWDVDAGLFVGGNSGGPRGTGLMTQDGGSVSVGTDVSVWSTGTFTMNAGTVDVTGQFRVFSGGTATLNGGTLTLGEDLAPPAAAAFNLAGATINVPALAGEPNAINWTAGTLNVTNAGVSIGLGQPLGDNLQLGPGKSLLVSGNLTVNAGAAIDINGGTARSANLDVAGDVTLLTGGLELSGSTVNVFGGGALDAPLTGTPTTNVTVQDPGSSWMMPGDLELGASAAGLGRIGKVTILPGTTVSVAGTVTRLSPFALTLAGGTLSAASIDLGTISFSGSGALLGDVHAVGTISANGTLTVGDPDSFTGIVFQGGLSVGSHIVTLNKLGFVSVPSFVSITGGMLNVPNGAAIAIGSTLFGFGSVNGRIAAQSGSLIFANGSLTLGDAASVAGFFSDGELNVRQHTVTLLDANEAVLGSLTTLGNGSNPGTLMIDRGARIEAGKNLVGFGTVQTPNDSAVPLVNDGAILGNTASQRIGLAGYLTGLGTLDRVTITGTDAPGPGPAAVTRGSVDYAGTVIVDVRVDGHDLIQHSGAVNLGGELRVTLGEGFIPGVGSTFMIMTFPSRTGTFSTLTGAAIDASRLFLLQYNATHVTLLVAPIVAPDFDMDGDVDDDDSDAFEACSTGPAQGPPAPGCENKDFDGDGDVDQSDFGIVQRCISGPNVPPNANCAG